MREKLSKKIAIKGTFMSVGLVALIGLGILEDDAKIKPLKEKPITLEYLGEISKLDNESRYFDFDKFSFVLDDNQTFNTPNFYEEFDCPYSVKGLNGKDGLLKKLSNAKKNKEKIEIEAIKMHDGKNRLIEIKFSDNAEYQFKPN